MSEPYVCPLCNGSGQVTVAMPMNAVETCHACGGKGIVWSPDISEPENWVPWGERFPHVVEQTTAVQSVNWNSLEPLKG